MPTEPCPSPGTLLHITLNTGHVRISPLAEVAADALAALRPFALSRSPWTLPPPFALYTVRPLAFGGLGVGPTRGAALWTVSRTGSAPMIAFGVAAAAGADARALWDALLDRLGGPVARAIPDACPWLGVVTMPALAVDPDAATWLGDFERCLAWAWLSARPIP